MRWKRKNEKSWEKKKSVEIEMKSVRVGRHWNVERRSMVELNRFVLKPPPQPSLQSQHQGQPSLWSILRR